MPILLKSSGTWRQIQSIHLKVNGVWRQIGLAFLKVNGVWRSLITSGAAPFIQSTVTISKSGTSTITLTGTNYHWTYFSSGNYAFQTSVDNSNWSTISSGSITNPSSGSSNTKTHVLAQGDYQSGATNYYRFTVSVSSTYGNTTTSTSGTVSHVVAAAPTITSLSASAPNSPAVQLVTITVNWASTNQASYFLNVLQTGVANYLDYGTTETSSYFSHGSNNNFQVYAGSSATITLRVYNGSLDGSGFPTGDYVEQSITYTPPVVAIPSPTITSLSASASTTSSVQLVTVTVSWSSTNQASYYLNVLQTGVASYNDYGTTETSSSQSHGSANNFQVYSGSSVSITLRVYNQGLDGNGFNTGSYVEQSISYTPPVVQTVTYGSCTAYGNPTSSSSGYTCSSNYSYPYTTLYYNQRRQVFYNGNWYGEYDYGCGNTSVTTYGSPSQVNGQCGYSTPVTPSITSGPSISWASGNNFTLSASASNATNLEFEVQFANNSLGSPVLATQTFFFGASSGGGQTGNRPAAQSWARTRVRANNSSTGLSSSFSGYTGWA
jgi:hypothetical protein